MSDIPEFVVDIEPGPGTSLRVCVQASGLAPIDDEVERALPSFASDDLDQLRSGSAGARITELVAGQVTSWLLQTDLRGHLGTAFNAATAPFRIVIREHPKVFASLAEVPFELLEFDADRLVLLNKVRAIVHVQKRPQILPAAAPRTGWPLRILLVRSNPADLGDNVPPILPLRESIQAFASTCGLGEAVQVTALSSEPGGSGRVTHDALLAQLRGQRPDVLVYLGHGDLQDAGPEGLPPMGVLQFEMAEGRYANPVDAETLRTELRNYPVPVVLLAGCLTSASAAIARRLPTWMRGSQSVAEALVYGGCGVQCVVGMRYRLETTDADRFLSSFFKSLLQDHPGDVEQAVHRGREDLAAQKRYPPSWSAPVMFRNGGTEPMFEWMRRPPELIDPIDEHVRRMREQSLKALGSLPANALDESRASWNEFLEQIDADYIKRWTQRGATVIWPAQVEAKTGALVRVEITQQGALTVSCLEGRLTFPGTLIARPPRLAAAPAAAGFHVYSELDRQGAASFILRTPDGSPAAIPAGALLELELEIPPGAAPVCSVATDGLKSEPPTMLRGWSNAIVLPPR